MSVVELATFGRQPPSSVSILQDVDSFTAAKLPVCRHIVVGRFGKQLYTAGMQMDGQVDRQLCGYIAVGKFGRQSPCRSVYRRAGDNRAVVNLRICRQKGWQ